MMSGALFSTLPIIIAASVGGISFPSEVIVRSGILHLADVADLTVLPDNLRNQAAKLRLMRLPVNSQPITLRADDIAARARSLMPALVPWFQKTDGTISVLRRKNDPMMLFADASQKEGIAKNDRVQIKIVTDIYTIERQGLAMSDAKNGQRFFARTKDGKALSVMCCGE